MGVGKKIKKIREFEHLGVKDLADRAGVSRQTIYNLEKHDRTARSDVLKKLADALDIDMVELLEGVEVKPRKKRKPNLKDLNLLLTQIKGLDKKDVELIMTVTRTLIRQKC